MENKNKNYFIKSKHKNGSDFFSENHSNNKIEQFFYLRERKKRCKKLNSTETF